MIFIDPKWLYGTEIKLKHILGLALQLVVSCLQFENTDLVALRFGLLEWFLAVSQLQLLDRLFSLLHPLVWPKLGNCVHLTQLEQQPMKPQVNITQTVHFWYFKKPGRPSPIPYLLIVKFGEFWMTEPFLYYCIALVANLNFMKTVWSHMKHDYNYIDPFIRMHVESCLRQGQHYAHLLFSDPIVINMLKLLWFISLNWAIKRCKLAWVFSFGLDYLLP